MIVTLGDVSRRNVLQALGLEERRRGSRGMGRSSPAGALQVCCFCAIVLADKIPNEGRSLDGCKFKFSEKIMKETFDCVIKGIMK